MKKFETFRHFVFFEWLQNMGKYTSFDRKLLNPHFGFVASLPFESIDIIFYVGPLRWEKLFGRKQRYGYLQWLVQEFWTMDEVDLKKAIQVKIEFLPFGAHQERFSVHIVKHHVAIF